MTRWFGLSENLTGELMLVLATVCFAIGFNFQRWAELRTLVLPCSYSASRNIVSGLLMVILRRHLIAATKSGVSSLSADEVGSFNWSNAKLWRYGLLCGVCNTFGSALQQTGLVTVTAGKVAFITSLYMVVIPFCECNIKIRTYVAALTALAGVYLLSGCAESEVCIGGSFGVGEFATLGSVFFWVASMMASDKAADDVDVNEIDLTTIEFCSSAVLGLVLAWLLEPESFVWPWPATQASLGSIIAVGCTEAAGFTLCILGQRVVGVSRTALLLSLEGAMTAFVGYLALNERLTLIELLGCVLLFFATKITASEDDDDENDNGELVGISMLPQFSNYQAIPFLAEVKPQPSRVRPIRGAEARGRESKT